MEFKYVACDKKGKRISAVAKAESIAGLVGHLKKQGLTPLRVSKISSAQAKIKKISNALSGQVKGRELAVFTRQLATILNAGVLLTEALSTLADDLENRFFRRIIKQMQEDINSGKSFSEVLSRYPRVFPQIYVSMVKSGEEIGNLGKTLSSLSKYLEDYERMSSKIKSALLYPIFLSGFLGFVVATIVLFLIPKFQRLFVHAGSRLPLLTRIVVGLSEFCLRNMLSVIISILVLIFLYWYSLRFPRVRFFSDSLQLKIPIFGKIIRKALIARFCRTLSILISGGVGIAVALLVSSEVVNNLYLKKIIEQIKNRVVSGAHLGEVMRSLGVFPRAVVKMVTVGEKSGKLGEMFERSADYYEEELEVTLNNFSSMIEPVFIVVIGIVVLIVVLALYLPVFKISTAVR